MKTQQIAMDFAAKAHSGQTYGKYPYTKHLGDVLSTLKRFGVTDEVILLAGILHDTREDTSVTSEQLKAEFGEEVNDVVYCVTNEEGKNRAERFKKTYPKIKGNIRATTVKLADRISNVEESIRTQGKQLSMYKSEFKSFKEGIQIKGLDPIIDRMWEHLESILA